MNNFEITIVVSVSISKEELKGSVTTAISNMLDNGAFITGKSEELLSVHVTDKVKSVSIYPVDDPFLD
jgi:uncharacterized protein (UPF0371 family)